ncbi:MAG TPA: PAS domain S-box protein, partial [Spirochaetota bacterium]|nr:PAS domain S-box protein [Spirochaetota bacterium]
MEKNTILLVEDEAIIAMDQANMLEANGFNVITVYTPDDAIAAVDAGSADLVLMDIDLGRGSMDGTQVAQVILSQHRIPIIFLTSHIEKEMVDRVKGITRYGYVIKNSGEFVLIEAIHMAFELFNAHQKTMESEEKYRAAFVTSPDSVNINRLDGLYVDINEGFTALTGYTREDVMGRSSTDIDIWAIPEDRNRLVKGLQKDGKVENLESVFRCKDGSLKTALMSAQIITINDEPHILSITRDITEKKEIEEKVQQSEKRFRSIFDNAADGILIGNNQGFITDANIAMTSITGYTHDELIGKNINILFTSEHLDEEPLRYNHVYKGFTVTRERKIVIKDGTEIQVLMNTSKVEDDCLQAIIHDVSHLRSAQEALRESEERFRLAVEGSRDGLWDWDLLTNDAYHSQQFATMLGYEPDDLPYTSAAWSDLLHPEDREKAFEQVNRYLEGKVDYYESTFRMKTKDGSYRW